MWNEALSKTVSKSTLWPQLHYIHQSAENGEFAASDNRILLVERTGAPFMFEWWNPDGTPANVQGLEYPDYFGMILKIRNMPPSKLEGIILPEQMERVKRFIGVGGTVHTSGLYQLHTSADGCRQAIIYAFEDRGKWRLLNTSEELMCECDTYEEAEQMGTLLGCEYIIRRNK